MADTKLYIEDFSIGVGETKTLAIMLDNSEAAWGVNATITLPDGLSVDFNGQNQVALTKNADRFSSNMQASLVKQNDGSFKFLVLTVTQAIKGNEGALVSFDVKNTGLRNNSQINMKDIKVVDKDGKSMGAPKTYNTNVVYKSYLDGVNEFSFAQEQLVFYPNVEADLNVALKNDADNLAGMEATFTVPDGVTISDEAVASETRAENMIITVNKTADKTYRVRMFPSAIGVITLPKITGNDGVLFTLKVKAAETVATGAKIRMNSVQLIDSKSVSYDREDDIEISMFNQGAADEAAAKAAAEAKVVELKTAAEALAVSAEAKAYEAENVKAAVATAEEAIAAANTAIAAVETEIAKGKLATTNKEAIVTAITAAETAISDAKAAIAAAEKVYTDQKAADEAEAAAKAAAEAKVAELKTAAAALAVSAEAKAYEAENVKAAVAAAEEAIAAVAPAIEAVEAKIAEGKLATDNAEALATAIAAVETAIADAKAAIAAAEKVYADQKAADEVEAAAKAAAEAKVVELKAAAEALAVSAEAKAYEAENVKAAVAAAEEAIAAVAPAIAAVEAKIAEGKLSTDNAEALATAIAAVETAIADAKAAIAAAEKVYADQKAADEVEAAAKAAAEAKVVELKAAAEALAVSAEAKAYEAENVKAAVTAAEEAIAAVAPAIAAVEAKIAEGKVSTDNKEALATVIAAAEKAIADAKTAIAAAEKAYADQKALDDAAEAGAKASAEASVTALKVSMEEVVILEAAKNYDADNVKTAVAAAEQAIANANAAIKVVEDLIAEGKLATDNKVAVAQAILAAQKAVDAADDAVEVANETYKQQRTDEEAAVDDANAKVVELKAAATALVISAEAKAYEAENVKTAVATAETAIAAVNTAIAAVEAKIAEGKLAAANKEALAAAIAAAEQAIADAQTAIATAEKAYADQKAADEAEAAAVVAANTKVTELKAAAADLAVSAEAKAYEADNVKTAVTAAETAIAAVAPAIEAVEAKIAEGKLSTENKEALAALIADAEQAITDAKTAIAAAEKTYADQKAADEAEAAAVVAANTKVTELKAAAADLAVSAEAKAYEADNVKTAVTAAETAIAAINPAIAAVEAKIAEGKLSTDNKEALATAIADAEQAITDAQTAIAAAEKAYTDQKAADDAAALAAAKESLKAAITAAKAANVEGMTAESVQALNDAIAAAEAALAAETATVESLNAAKTDVEAAVAGLVVAPLFADGKYYIYNNGVQKYLAAGASWGTHAVVNATGLDYTLTLADGKYTMDSQVSKGGNKHFLNGEWNDGDAMGWTFEAVEGKEGVYTISNGTQFLTAQENGEVLLKEDATVEAAQWTLKTVEARVAELAAATAEAPVDASFLITDANFGRNDLRKSAWTTEASNLNMSGGNNTNNCAESYHSVFSLSQTLTNLPKGVYALTAQGFYRQDGQDNDNLPVFFANNEAITFPAMTGSENNMSQASESFTAGNYTIAPIYVQVAEDGQLTVGAKLEENTALWCIWDNFQLTYYGADADIEQLKNAAIIAELAALRKQLAEKKDQVEVEVVKTEAENALTATADVTGTDAINAAVETLKAALDKVEASLDAKAKLANMKELVDATNVYTAEAKNEYYDQWVVKYNDGTITKAEANALQDPFIVTGWHANITVDNFLLSAWDTNPDFQDAPYYINSWSIEGESDGSNFKVPFFEYWTNDDKSLAEKTLTATMNGLEAGNYDVTAWVRVRAKNGYEAPVTGITMQANDGEAVDVAAGDQVGESQFYLKEFTATGTVAEDGILKIKFNVAADNNISWLSFKNVKFGEHQITPEEIAALELEAAKADLQTAITAAKAIETEGKNGADALATAITDAETALNAADATVETLAAAKVALAQAISVFNKANLDANLIEIAQSQSPEIQDGANRADVVEGDGYNQYTTKGDISVIIKMMNIDVKNCDYVVVKFAEPVPAGISIAFWNGNDNVTIPEGATEYKYVFAEDNKCAIANDVLPQICILTLWNGGKVVKIEGVYKHQIPVEITHTWDFTKWSEATVANLKADAAASKLTGWSDVEKMADAEAGVEPTEASKDNCFWAVIPEGGELKANGEVIEELKGLQFGTTFAGKRSLAIAVNYPTTSLGTYAGPAYLWLGGKNFECFTIPAVKGGTKITMGVESHKPAEARGVQLFAGETELKDADGNAVAAPKTYTEQTWVVPAGVAYDIVVKNTNGCHIYFIDAEQDEATLTSINTVKSNVMNNAIYNLNGQKVNKAQKGLFIINGKKVVIK